MKLLHIITILALYSKAVLSQDLQEKAETGAQNSVLLTTSPKYLNIPERTTSALGAAEFVMEVADWSLEEREQAIVKAIQMGNVPSFSRILKPINVSDSLGNKLTFFATVDYLAIGSDADYMYVPMTPLTAQVLADQLDCLLPTQKMVDLIYAQADIKLRPQPIPPSEAMTTVPVFWQHSDSIKYQMAEMGFDRLSQNLVAGHKKDIITSNKIVEENKSIGKVVIYGWHQNEKSHIQPVYAGHSDSYADYSHGVRFVYKVGFLNGVAIAFEEVLRDDSNCNLISDEGKVEKPYYPRE